MIGTLAEPLKLKLSLFLIRDAFALWPRKPLRRIHITGTLLSLLNITNSTKALVYVW